MSGCRRDQNISMGKRSSGFGPVSMREKRENGGSCGMFRKDLSYMK